MINRVTGEMTFVSGLRILPQTSVWTLSAAPRSPFKIETHKLSLAGWKRHVLGFHVSEHGTFEVEALSAGEDRIQMVLLAHKHSFYEPNTLDDSERRAFHEGVISTDLAGQKEFAWGEVRCRFEAPSNKDWLIVAYSCDAYVPAASAEVLLHFYGRENGPRS